MAQSDGSLHIITVFLPTGSQACSVSVIRVAKT